MLTWLPEERMTARELMEHPFFNDWGMISICISITVQLRCPLAHYYGPTLRATPYNLKSDSIYLPLLVGFGNVLTVRKARINHQPIRVRYSQKVYVMNYMIPSQYGGSTGYDWHARYDYCGGYCSGIIGFATRCMRVLAILVAICSWHFQVHEPVVIF